MMSADSSKRQSKQGISGQVVLPQPVNDPSIIDSVAGFIHEVVPQACQSVLSATSGIEVNKESIVWAKFHVCDYNDPENFLADTECQSDSVPPLLIILGYGSGVQVWGVSGGGEGRELLSYPQGNVRCLQVLFSPQPSGSKDLLASKRPLIAIVDNTGPGPQFHTLNFISLTTAEVVKSIKFNKTAICEVLCNKKSVVVTFAERIAIFDVLTLEDRLTVTTCYPSPGINPNPIALGPRWLAYCDKKLTTWQRSSGGCEDEGAQSYTATVIHAAKSLSKGLRDLSGSLTGTSPQPQTNTSQPGVVTVIDIETPKAGKQQGGTEEEQGSAGNMVAHFVGHTGPIVAMTFDPSGMLLVVADKYGHRFNVFRLHPHPSSPALAAVHHLYILHRGDTTARVQDITVSWDSRWVAVSSLRGTTHVFPITPYGGPVAVRTHTTPHVVNRLSRFERSAGLSDGRGSPEGAASVLGGSPRLPPYPHPIVLSPLAQIRRTPTGGDSVEATPAPTVLRLAARFAPPRALLPPRATPPRTPRHQPKPRVADSLFIISSYGSLVQYDIEPRSPANVPKDKISYDTGIEVSVEAKGEWVLVRPPYLASVQPPLSLGNPLLPPTPTPQPTHTSRLVETHSPQLHHPAKGQDDRWLSQVEIITHTGPHRRLWMGPQFSFKSLDHSNPSEGEQPEPENLPPRSNPVNMPRRPYLWIESSSGGSVDAPYMTDNSEDDSIHGETRLREDLADAMMDTALHASGGVVEGGDGGGVPIEGFDRALERRITQFGLVVPVSPVVLPEVRIPASAVPIGSKITSASAIQDTVIAVASGSCCLNEDGSQASSLESPSIVTETCATFDETVPKSTEYSEVATSTYSVALARTCFQVDAQTETSTLEMSPPLVSDKSLNTSMIFEPVSLPLTSSSSENSSKVSEHSESCSENTEKSSNGSSSENSSGQDTTVKKLEKPGKESKKKKGDMKDKNKKILEILVSSGGSRVSNDIIIPFTESKPEFICASVEETSLQPEQCLETFQAIPGSEIVKSEEALIDESAVICEEMDLPSQPVNIASGYDDVIVLSPSEETSALLEEISNASVEDVNKEKIETESSVGKPVKYMDDTEVKPVSGSSTEPSMMCKSMSHIERKSKTSKVQNYCKMELSLSVSGPSKKDSGRGKKKKKNLDARTISSVVVKDGERVDDKKTECWRTGGKVDVISIEETSHNKPAGQCKQQKLKDTIPVPISQEIVAEVKDPFECFGILKEPLIKLDISSDDDKVINKDPDEKVESESTESSGVGFLTVTCKKKGRTSGKNKFNLPDVGREELVVSCISEESKVHAENVVETVSSIQKFKEVVENEMKNVEDEIIVVDVEELNEPVGSCIVDNEEKEMIDTVVVSESVVSEPASAVEENSDQVSTREETSDAINKSDSEFFVPVTEKRKKKRKNVKETGKSDGKDTPPPCTDSEPGKKEESLEVRRSRRESRSKAKSPSPSPKSDIPADSESSDEAVLTQVRPQTPKLPKRKKAGRKSDTSETREEEPQMKTKSDAASDIDYETCSEKKSDSSVDSFFDRIRTIDPFSKCWSAGIQDKAVEDKDSVYESCNDDELPGLSQTTTTTTVKPFPEPAPESSSSLTEDKTDSGDKDLAGPSQTSTKKHKKQKKKKR